MLALDQVKDDMGGKSIFPFFVAKPFSACFVAALHDTAFVADSAVGAGVRREFFLQGLLRAAI